MSIRNPIYGKLKAAPPALLVIIMDKIYLISKQLLLD